MSNKAHANWMSSDMFETFANVAAWVFQNVQNTDAGEAEHEVGGVTWGNGEFEIGERYFRVVGSYEKDAHGFLNYTAEALVDYEAHADKPESDWQIAKIRDSEAGEVCEGRAEDVQGMVLQMWLRGLAIQHDVCGFWR